MLRYGAIIAGLGPVLAWSGVLAVGSSGPDSGEAGGASTVKPRLQSTGGWLNRRYRTRERWSYAQVLVIARLNSTYRLLWMIQP